MADSELEKSVENPPASLSVAELLDHIPWDFDPSLEISPLVVTEVFFRDFPWDAEE